MPLCALPSLLENIHTQHMLQHKGQGAFPPIFSSVSGSNNMPELLSQSQPQHTSLHCGQRSDSLLPEISVPAALFDLILSLLATPLLASFLSVCMLLPILTGSGC